jgi:hypothetical protein
MKHQVCLRIARTVDYRHEPLAVFQIGTRSPVEVNQGFHLGDFANRPQFPATRRPNGREGSGTSECVNCHHFATTSDVKTLPLLRVRLCKLRAQ